MSRFFKISFIVLTLVVSTAGVAPAVHAQSSCGEGKPECPTNQSCDGWPTGTCVATTAAGTPGATAAAAASAAKAAANTLAGGLPKDPDGTEGFGTIMTWIMSLFAWLVGVAALTLNYAVYYTVVTMGDYVHKLSAIGVTWRILRDIANIMFIFGFLGAGIATILNVDQYGWKTKMLPMLLIGAIFLNFSLFITEAMIDGTNLFATQFYTQIVGGTLPTAADMANMTIESEGISNKIMGQLGLQTIYTEGRTNTGVFKAGNTWVIGFMGIILFIITAFVMFSLAFILIARFVALIFFIILCPVAFMGLALPGMQYRAKQWWTNFLEQIITAPVLMLLLYVALAVITDAQFLTGVCSPAAGSTNTACTSNWLGWVDGNFAGFASMMLSFLVAMGLLLVVVIKAKSMSAFGAAGAIKLGGKLSFGATAFGLRQTAGRGLQAASRRFNASSWSRKPGIGRATSAALSYGATSSFDARGIKAGGGLSAIGGIDAGKAQEGGFRAIQKEKKEATKAYDTETKVGRLKDEIGKKTPNPAEVNKIMRSLTDDDFKDDGLISLIKKEPLVVEGLTGHQASNLPDAVIMHPNVYSHLSPSQLDAVRNAKNMAPVNARILGPQIYALGGRFKTWVDGRTGNQAKDVKDFWDVP